MTIKDTVGPTLKIARYKKTTWKNNYAIAYCPSSLIPGGKDGQSKQVSTAQQTSLTTSIEPEQERLLRGQFLSLKEPVEERPAAVLVDSEVMRPLGSLAGHRGRTPYQLAAHPVL